MMPSGEQAWQHLPQCRGRHPHLHRFDEVCQEPPRALLLGASNSWFSVYRSALTIPTDARDDNEVHRKVEERWDDLLDIEDRVILDYVINRLRRGQGEQQRRWLLDYDPDEIWVTIVRRRREVPSDAEDDEEDTDLRGPEWRAFSSSEALNLEEFKIRRLPIPAGFEDELDNPVAADRLARGDRSVRVHPHRRP